MLGCLRASHNPHTLLDSPLKQTQVFALFRPPINNHGKDIFDIQLKPWPTGLTTKDIKIRTLEILAI